MKRFHLLSLGLAVLFLTVGAMTALAQDNRSAAELASAETEWMTETLSLNDQQAKEIKAINLNYAEKMAALKAAPGGKEANEAEYKQLKKAKEEELKGVLSAEQFQTYLVKKKEWMEKQKEGKTGSR